ncbi:hypothetical protein NpPPO83_00008668 [Neofusicoccum parvum]|uniref:Uncharacterized protein n=1 Tax=Neofusicoccum parvum TaxID=310453 RepID=A0ACB5S7N5_9PEZI|nr:hypothetical protein NpPPO83_00008668 [Neofusicoccum parvum]
MRAGLSYLVHFAVFFFAVFFFAVFFFAVFFFVVFFFAVFFFAVFFFAVFFFAIFFFTVTINPVILLHIGNRDLTVIPLLPRLASITTVNLFPGYTPFRVQPVEAVIFVSIT